MKNKILILLGFIVLILFTNVNAQNNDSVFFTSGFKIGELSDTSIVVWTRLCKTSKPKPIKHKRKAAPYRSPIEFDNNIPAYSMDGAVDGSFGQVKIKISSKDTAFSTEWCYVSSYKDFTFKKRISGLNPNMEYSITIEGRKNNKSPITLVRGEFKTAPSKNEIVPVTFTSSTCQYFWDYDDSIRGFKIYDAMSKINPLFHCQTGDYVYYDLPGPMARSVELARHKWHAMNSWPSLVEFYSDVPLLLQKDDHDMLKNDASPSISPLGELSFDDAISIWNEQAPVDGQPYRTFRYGKDLQIWLIEGREFRSDNWEPDGANKTMLGIVQKQWFKQTVESSDATFKILLSPTPIVGPGTVLNKKDNHTNKAFNTEGVWLRSFLAKNEMIVINGDAHWQYVSVDSTSGVMEFCPGASSNEHATGWDNNDKRPEHKFLRVDGGFLSIHIYRDGIPILKIKHHDVNGAIVNEEIISKQ